jgi:hypothetical protein
MIQKREANAARVDLIVLKRHAKRPGMHAAEAGPVAELTATIPRNVTPATMAYRLAAVLSGDVGGTVGLITHDDVSGDQSRVSSEDILRAGEMAAPDAKIITNGLYDVDWWSYDGDGFGRCLNDVSAHCAIVCALPNSASALFDGAANILAAVYGTGGVYDLRLKAGASTAAKRTKRKTRRKSKQAVA